MMVKPSMSHESVAVASAVSVVSLLMYDNNRAGMRDSETLSMAIGLAHLRSRY